MQEIAARPGPTPRLAANLGVARGSAGRAGGWARSRQLPTRRSGAGCGSQTRPFSAGPARSGPSHVRDALTCEREAGARRAAAGRHPAAAAVADRPPRVRTPVCGTCGGPPGGHTDRPRTAGTAGTAGLAGPDAPRRRNAAQEPDRAG